jgi:hypothetical protein
MGSSIAELRALTCPSWRRGRSATQSARSVVVGGCRSGKSIIFWVCFFPVPSRVVCVRACVKGPGEARHDIAAAPGPLNRFRLLPLQVPPRRSSTPRRAPKIPKTIFPARCSIRISEFSQIPQNTKGPTGAKNSKLGSGFQGFWV